MRARKMENEVQDVTGRAGPFAEFDERDGLAAWRCPGSSRIAPQPAQHRADDGGEEGRAEFLARQGRKRHAGVKGDGGPEGQDDDPQHRVVEAHDRSARGGDCSWLYLMTPASFITLPSEASLCFMKPVNVVRPHVDPAEAALVENLGEGRILGQLLERRHQDVDDLLGQALGAGEAAPGGQRPVDALFLERRQVRDSWGCARRPSARSP